MTVTPEEKPKSNKVLWIVVGCSVFALFAFVGVTCVAAIAIPSLVVNRTQANESNAIASLKQYATAQMVWKKAKYDTENPGNFTPDFTQLATKDLIPAVMADATNPDTGYQGYYFMADPAVSDWEHEIGLYAIPCRYGSSGVNTFYIDATGVVYMKDLEGELPSGIDRSDWLLP